MPTRVFSRIGVPTRFVVAAVVSLCGLCAAASPVPPSRTTPAPRKSPRLAQVFDAWSDRQERIKSFHFTWDVRYVLPQGYRFPFTRGLAGVRKGNARIDPAKDVEFTIKQSEWWGQWANRWRSDFGSYEYDETAGWKEAARFRLTRDGSLYSRLSVPTSSADAPTIAIWRKVEVPNPVFDGRSGDSLLIDREVDLAPLRFAVRPLGPASEWTPENCRVVSEDVRAGNSHCIQLQMDVVNHSEQCWVDPSRGYSVVRWKRREFRLPPIDVTIDLRQAAGGEWLPSRWEWRLPGRDAGPEARFESTVSKFAINEKLPAGIFGTATPPRTLVFDASVNLPIDDGDDHPRALSASEAQVTLNAIADAWLRRQAKIQRFQYTWRSVGAADTVHTICLDGDKLMTEHHSAGRDVSRPEAQPLGASFGGISKVQDSKCVFDGATSRRIFFSQDPAQSREVATLSTGYHDPSGGNPSLMLAYRALHPIFGSIKATDLRDPSKFRVLAQRGKIGDVACVVIETKLNPGMLWSLWLDPARDYLPLREHRTMNGEDRIRIDLSYRADATCGWVVTGWKQANVGIGGMLLNPVIDTVTEFTVNQPIPASNFQLEIPRNAQVTDNRIKPRSEDQKRADAAQQAKMAASLAAREAKERAKSKPKPTKPIFDPFADAAADVEAALKVARVTNKRVLIEFGANWCPECRELGVVLKENADVAAAVEQGFVLVLVDTGTAAGQKLQERYVPPQRQWNSILHLAVLDPAGNVLVNDNTRAFQDGGDFVISTVKGFLAQWSSTE
jgi:thiol-disulfide isomerase/thioredoxin